MASCETDRAGICIARKRGDTAPDKITVLDPEAAVAGTPLDVTGFSFQLTVNTEEDPDPVGPPIVGVELVTIAGTLIDAPNGVIEFPWSPTEADQTPDEYFYDIQQTDTAGKILTIAKEQYIFQQDLTK